MTKEYMKKAMIWSQLMLLEGDFAFIHFFCCQPGICHPEYPYDDPGHNKQEHAG